MAKDDYFNLVFRALVFLYKKLKGKTNESTVDVLRPTGKDFGISESYFDYVIEHMNSEGLIEYIDEIILLNGDSLHKVTEETRITPKGIEYLENNSNMQKIARALTGAADRIIDIASIFV